ncbi:hypothetical protein Y032_0002g938 [Ancylostoma ceylanicum]|uniref:Uncharacterized protein n=1 Tax=Ancylostoma ceylanicum TaxID=53326 RepID=A0A016W336_9BILA|nr:hypothetical protein Y032_0002g938 [Ancylostoma ceylanicum]
MNSRSHSHIFLDLWCDKNVDTLGVDGDGLSLASRSTRRDRVANDGLVATVANLDLLDSRSSHLKLTKTS